MTTSATPPPSQNTHVHPAWFSWIQRHAALSGLLLAQWAVTTLMVLMVSVSDPGQAQHWAWFDWINFAVAILLGLAGAGIALGLSAAMADAYGSGKWIKGTFGMFGVLLLVSFDIWAGVAERSRQARPTPADEWLANTTGITALGVVPISVLFVAFLHASLILFYGWSARPQVVETEAEMAARQRKELLKAQHHAALREVQAAGLARAGRAVAAGLTGKKDEPIPATTQAGFPGEDSAATGDNLVTFPGPKRAAKKTGLQWTAGDLQTYIRATYGAALSDESATSTIQFLGGNKRQDGVPGRPYYANNRKAKAWADRQYGGAQEPATFAD
jgi:hypothetical protein